MSELPTPPDTKESHPDITESAGDDDTPICPQCSCPCKRDWEGDPNVINGTHDFWVCPECETQVIDEMSALAVTETLFTWAKKQGLMPE